MPPLHAPLISHSQREARSASSRNTRGGAAVASRGDHRAPRNRRRPQAPRLARAVCLFVLKLLILTGVILPACWVGSVVLFQLGAESTSIRQLLSSPAFLQFAAGLAVWFLVFFTLPRPATLYVFGHELTHALWSMLIGGKIKRFRFSRRGGEVVTSRSNLWVALAPYFFPIYAVLWVIVWAVLRLVMPGAWEQPLLFSGLGLTWGFHLTFTVLMLLHGQSDLRYGGVIFSLALVYLLNLLVLQGLLGMFLPETGFVEISQQWLRVTRESWIALTAALP